MGQQMYDYVHEEDDRIQQAESRAAEIAARARKMVAARDPSKPSTSHYLDDDYYESGMAD